MDSYIKTKIDAFRLFKDLDMIGFVLSQKHTCDNKCATGDIFDLF